LSRTLGAVQMAVILLPLFAAVLFLGTVLESWHDRQVAQELVYGTWWFVTLLALLGLNIFCAAVKKWPWKRHQTGFLITHLGLLTLVAGGLIDGLAGSSGALVLVDSDDLEATRQAPHSSSRFIDRGVHTLRVVRPERGSGEVLQASF